MVGSLVEYHRDFVEDTEAEIEDVTNLDSLVTRPV